MHKINRFPMVVALATALFLQMTALNYIKIFGVKPDLVLILVVFFGLFFGRGAGLEFGLIAGILTDIFTLDFFGINTFMLGITGLIAGALNAGFSRESRMTEVLLVFFFTAFYMSFHFLIEVFLLGSLALKFSEYFFTSVLPGGIYTSIVSIPVFSKFIDIYNLRDMEDLL